jgi:acetylornithine deacetylase/succinyl-diaminopimelate desuccinylase-like protein
MTFRRSAPSALSRAEHRLRDLRPLLRPLADALRARDAATLESQVRLAQLAAPTGGETRRAALVADAFRLRGFTHVHTDRVGNVIARRPPQASSATHAPLAQPIVCMAHLDTVFAADTPLLLRHEGARLVCPGIGDNARGLAAMLAIADTLGVPGLDGDAASLTHAVEFVATVGEEGLGNLRGARGYFDDLATEGRVPLAVLALDGPGDERIVHHALGSRRYRITFHGPGGHSWADFGRPNAIHAAGRAAFWLATMPSEFRSAVAVSVGRIGGGESLTAIPTLAWMEVDVRATDDAVLGRADRQLRSVVRQATLDENRGHADAPMRAEVTVLGERPAGQLPADHPVVALATAATHDGGREAMSAIASTDANIPLSRGIPAITIGAGGRGGGAHTPDEWYENADGPRGLVRALTILTALAR